MFSQFPAAGLMAAAQAVAAVTLDLSGHKNSANPAPLCLVVNSDTAKECGLDWQPIANWLIAAGYDLTILDLGRETEPVPFPAKASYHRLAGHYQEKHWYLPLRSLFTYQWLKQHQFAQVIFYQDFGSAYYATIARRLGLALEDTTLIGWLTPPLAARLEAAEQFPDGRTTIEQDFIERTTASHLNHVIIDQPATHHWLKIAGWDLPESSAVVTQNSKEKLCDWLQHRSVPVTPAIATSEIFISILLATYNRPDRLRRAIASLEQQTAQNFELIVVDDGSTDAGIATLKNELAPLFTARGWHWMEQANAGPAAARNRVLELGRGSHIMFMDDDNLALPAEIACFTKAATSGADILTCLPGLSEGSDLGIPPIGIIPSLAEPSGEKLPAAWAPVGACLSLALFTNPFGDTNALYRRDVFAALGGFRGDRSMVFEDFELLTRAVIAGYRLEVIPEILFMYLRHWDSRSIGATIFRSHLESLRPLAALLPPWLRASLLVPRAHWYNQTLKLQNNKKCG